MSVHAEGEIRDLQQYELLRNFCRLHCFVVDHDVCPGGTVHFLTKEQMLEKTNGCTGTHYTVTANQRYSSY